MYKLNLRGYIIAVIGRALVVVAGYIGSIPLMLAFTALAALGQGPWQGDMNAVIASCSEYTYLTQGKRVDGTMYSWYFAWCKDRRRNRNGGCRLAP